MAVFSLENRNQFKGLRWWVVDNNNRLFSLKLYSKCLMNVLKHCHMTETFYIIVSE